ncbi:MAG: 50S ribosomal protein L21 [Candidatus Dormibacteraeota bacterium]|nr:50S ribosomal protein L21 [Candidatus Dormibacteraeota bacterium]
MPNSSGPLTAVVVSGGKQYRVASGDRILVDRLAAAPGARLALERVLMVAGGDEVKIGAEALAGQVVTVRVLEHRRGPKIDVLRYKPKKRVRVHRGARADLTALEVLSVGAPLPDEPDEADEKPAKRRSKKSLPREVGGVPRPSAGGRGSREAAEPEATAAAEPQIAEPEPAEPEPAAEPKSAADPEKPEETG